MFAFDDIQQIAESISNEISNDAVKGKLAVNAETSFQGEDFNKSNFESPVSQEGADESADVTSSSNKSLEQAVQNLTQNVSNLVSSVNTSVDKSIQSINTAVDKSMQSVNNTIDSSVTQNTENINNSLNSILNSTEVFNNTASQAFSDETSNKNSIINNSEFKQLLGDTLSETNTENNESKTEFNESRSNSAVSGSESVANSFSTTNLFQSENQDPNSVQTIESMASVSDPNQIVINSQSGFSSVVSDIQNNSEMIEKIKEQSIQKQDEASVGLLKQIVTQNTELLSAIRNIKVEVPNQASQSGDSRAHSNGPAEPSSKTEVQESKSTSVNLVSQPGRTELLLMQIVSLLSGKLKVQTDPWN